RPSRSHDRSRPSRDRRSDAARPPGGPRRRRRPTLTPRTCMTLARPAFVLLLVSSTAFAQSPAAESLFREGRALIKQGRLQDGCEKSEASETIERSVGTLLTLGDCREKLGKIASAWAAFRKAEAMAKASGKDDKRVAEAERRAARLEPQLPNLTISAKQ